MKILALLAALGVVLAPPAGGEGGRLNWPLRPRPAVIRTFDAPSSNWNRGHRGVDLAGSSGQTVYAAAPGTVVFASPLAGRPVVSIAHPGGLRTSYEPVQAAVRVGQLVDSGAAIGVLITGHPGCGAPACLHWGAMWGPASRADYVDPLGLLAATPVRLKPLRWSRPTPAGGLDRGRRADGPRSRGCRAAWSPGSSARAAPERPVGPPRLRADGWPHCAETRADRCRGPR